VDAYVLGESALLQEKEKEVTVHIW